jgi:hypothetical protein
MLSITIILLIVMLNQKLYYFSTYFYAIEFYFFKGLAGCLFIDILTFSLAIYVILGSVVFSCNSYHRYNNCQRILAVFGIVIALWVHISFLYHAFYTDNSPFLWFSVQCMFWQLFISLSSAVIIGLCYLANKLY